MYNLSEDIFSISRCTISYNDDKEEHMQQRRLLVIITALILSSLAYLLLLPVPLAQAHAYVIGSDPVDGSTIATAPTVIRIFFNTSISSVSSAHVLAVGTGNLVDVGAAPALSHQPVHANSIY